MTAREVMSAMPSDAFARFERFLITAGARDEITYHIGDLCVEAEHNAALSHLRRRVWKAHEAGAVRLVQRRVSPGVFAYVAIRRGDCARGVP